MEFLAFLGGFLAVAAAIFLICLAVKRKLRDLSLHLFGTKDLLQALRNSNAITEELPRSLNGCDSILLPQILEDFPDFDITLAKTYARDELKKILAKKQHVHIHNVVIAKYFRAKVQKTIVLQAAVSHTEGSRTIQLRYELNYTYVVQGQSSTVAANCPNCGGVLTYGETVCPFCESRVTSVLSASWKFTQIQQR